MIRWLSGLTMRLYVLAFGWEYATLHLSRIVRALPGKDGTP